MPVIKTAEPSTSPKVSPKRDVFTVADKYAISRTLEIINCHNYSFLNAKYPSKPARKAPKN